MKVFLFSIIGLVTWGAPLPPEADVDVIVIGAGWSGMGAAEQLHLHKKNFIVLESTNRTGGRTQAIKFGHPSVGQFIFELGSNWVDGSPFAGGPSHKRNPVLEEVHKIRQEGGKFHLQLIPGGTQNMSNYWRVYDKTGNRADADGHIRDAAFKAQDCINRTASHGGKDKTLRQALIDCHWEPKTEAEWAVDWGFTVDDPGFVAKEQSLEGTLPDETYMWWGDDDQFVVDQNPRGYAHLLDHMMAKTVPSNDSRIKFNSRVKQIDYSNNPVKVTTTDGTIYTAGAVISTLPLGVIQHEYKTLFVPPMPDKQVQTYTHDGAIMAHLTKIFAQFEDVFWDDTAARWLSADDELGAFPEWHNMNHKLHVPGSKTLFIWLGQPQSTKYEAMSDDDVTKALMDYIRRHYPGKTIKDPVAFHITRHSLDPNRYGSYSGFKFGWTEHDYDVMVRPLKANGDDKVYFAGEHTCNDLSGFTHGAYIRGGEVAKDYLGVHYKTLCDA